MLVAMPIPTVILMTSNGVGMGHLSRQLTIALSGHARFRPIIFSLSKALPRVMLAEAEGELPEALGHDLQYEYCPSRESGWLPAGGWQRKLRQTYQSYRWHPYLRDRLLALIGETNAAAVVFDGAFPYRGLLDVRSIRPDLPLLWVRRGMWKREVDQKRLQLAEKFDAVIAPGDFGSSHDVGPTSTAPALRTAPISLQHVLTPLSKTEAKRALGLDPDRQALLLAPGSGALGSVEDVAAEVRKVVGELAPDWQVAVTKQSIARHTIGGDGVLLLNNIYPLVRYLHAFDAAVSAAGYNSVHELLASQVPTLFIPSVNHATDDQRSRAAGVAARGAALVSGADLTRVNQSTTLPELPTALEALLDSSVRERLTAVCARLEPASGGEEAAAHIISHVSDRPKTQPLLEIPAPSRPLFDARTRTSRLIFTDAPTTALLHGNAPVEHILAGASSEYRRTRRLAAGWLYRSP